MIGVKLKYLRTERGYSITQLAKKAQISKSYLSYLEKNPGTNPSLQVLTKIAEALDTSPNYFMEDTGQKADKPCSQEWINLLRDGLEEDITKEDLEEVQRYMAFIKFKKSH
ncbi:helix-turn-helix transcriptional regulator [Domibacillus sp. DTU_2020_1001157_1_SI_ALB_TIR_016]|uniref:helix-turn-helix domain-containing protein n=1 Tax=Domibacillus sp. DTU_2020_1001157_1_SI_ALB_TIR_016 TaxID=3077789 RepID=UPI0028E9B3DA|nr:helix-turn-helix transcriptional regulator [Domibacillus sp. DTU_2020_1001157_1_SI_ALB_TIR_016]WNS81202.1 helix-turn-helix transcriptional regulator [Domibacillus sp. DTU_2020_1001157_1_SI_ALB_TIR_016]